MPPAGFSFILSNGNPVCEKAGSVTRRPKKATQSLKDFANFTSAQNQEIELISEEFLNWFTENELETVKLLLNSLKSIDLENPEKDISSAYRDGEDLVRRINKYFEKP